MAELQAAARSECAFAVKRLKADTDELLLNTATALDAIAHGDGAGSGGARDSDSEESRWTRGDTSHHDASDHESPWLHNLRDEAGALTATGAKLENLLRKLPPSPIRDARPAATQRPTAGTGSAEASFSHDDENDDDYHNYHHVLPVGRKSPSATPLRLRHTVSAAAASSAPPGGPRAAGSRHGSRGRGMSLAASALARSSDSDAGSVRSHGAASTSFKLRGLHREAAGTFGLGERCAGARHGVSRSGAAHASGELMAAAAAWLSLVREHCNTCMERVERDRATAVRLQAELALRHRAAAGPA